MSFSFSFRADGKEQAKERARNELFQVIEQQPEHERDRDHVLMTIEAYVNMLPEATEAQEVTLAVSGTLLLAGETIMGAGVSVTAGVLDR